MIILKNRRNFFVFPGFANEESSDGSSEGDVNNEGTSYRKVKLTKQYSAADPIFLSNMVIFFASGTPRIYRITFSRNELGTKHQHDRCID
mmetsp:Transcript_17525/g.23022  ORF Transcript_17525/g.23022 Transcript_17525/m.23022 type:complete len:90 (-) Transcript_17525:531-800(-)